MLKILPDEEVAEEEEEEEILEERGENKLKLKNLIFIAYATIKTGMMHLHVSCLGIKLRSKEIKKKVKIMTETKVKHLNLLFMSKSYSLFRIQRGGHLSKSFLSFCKIFLKGLKIDFHKVSTCLQ